MRFVATEAGIYSLSVNLRIDGADMGHFGVVIGRNGNMDANMGIHAIVGDASDQYDNLVTGGLVQMQKGQYVSVFVYASADTSWHLDSECGFSGAYVGPLTSEGFQV